MTGLGFARKLVSNKESDSFCLCPWYRVLTYFLNFLEGSSVVMLTLIRSVVVGPSRVKDVGGDGTRCGQTAL